MISYTPVGTMQLKRCFFRIDKDARWGDVRDAIASHRTSEGGDGIVTLVLERPVEDDSAPLAREPATAKIAALQDIVLWPPISNALTGEKAKEISKSRFPVSPNFLGLVLGCIEAKFCK